MNILERRKWYDRLASEREGWFRRDRYFHREIRRAYAALVPEGASVLEAGCGIGDLLASLKPKRGVGIDFSERAIAIARQRHPPLQFECMDAQQLQWNEAFDYIVVSGLLGDLEDIQVFLEHLKPLCHARTRLILNYYNVLWEPLWLIAEKLGLKMPQPQQNWLRMENVTSLLHLTGYETICQQFRILCPFGIPLVSSLANRLLAIIPGIEWFGLTGVIVARLSPRFTPSPTSPTCSIVIPCRNERGNIAAIFERTPSLGAWTELIFVDGNSTDGTLEEIQRQAQIHPERRVICFSQGRATGKGDAVRQGFSRATGDILMILDADLTTPPEALPKFYRALVDGSGEFINGNRMLYPMERQAMRTLNILANWFFGRVLSWLIGQKVGDTLCGTKALFRSDYQKITEGRAFFGDFDPFGDFDLLFGASRLHLKIIDIPVRYRERTYGTTNIKRFRHGWLLLKMCFFALAKLKMR